MSASFRGDPYFAKEEDILKSYEIDYVASVDFNQKLTFSQTMIPLMIPHFWIFAPCILGYALSPLPNKNVEETVRGQHVGITRDGIKFIQERHGSGCRCACQEVGKVSKTVPFDKITDCDVEEPAGSSGCCCCLVKNTLMQINVDTASSSNGRELTLQGLVDPHQFKKDVWSMKRGEGIEGISAVSAMVISRNENTASSEPAQSAYAPVISTSGGGGSSDAALPLLREQNVLLKEIADTVKKQLKLSGSAV